MNKNIQDNYHEIMNSIEEEFYEMYVAAEEDDIASGGEPSMSYPSLDYALEASLLAIEKEVYKDVLDSGQIREKGQVLAEIVQQRKSITLSSDKILIADIDIDKGSISSYLNFLESYATANKASFTIYKSLNGLRIFQFHTIYDNLDSILAVLQDIKSDPKYIEFVAKTNACYARLTPKNDLYMDYWNLVKTNEFSPDYHNCLCKVSEFLQTFYYSEDTQELKTGDFFPVNELNRVKAYYDHYTRSFRSYTGILS